MKHEEFEQQMFAHVNENCKMKELDRQEFARAAKEVYQIVRKRHKIEAVFHLIAWTACFATILFGVIVLNALGHLPSLIAIIGMSLIGYIVGLNTNALMRRIKK